MLPQYESPTEGPKGKRNANVIYLMTSLCSQADMGPDYAWGALYAAKKSVLQTPQSPNRQKRCLILISEGQELHR